MYRNFYLDYLVLNLLKLIQNSGTMKMPSFFKSTPLLHVTTALIFAVVTLIVSVILDNYKHKEVTVLLILGLYFIILHSTHRLVG